MSRDPPDHAEVSRHGPFSTRRQATQTLPVQTQSPTQLMSHELHQYTQLVHHSSAEQQLVRGDTLVNDTDTEGSGNTVLLNDDVEDDGEMHGEVDSGGGNSIKRCENMPHSTLQIHRDLPDSDATTEEGDAENTWHLVADAESRPLCTDEPLGKHEVAKTGENPLELAHFALPEVEGGGVNVTQQETPQAVDTNGSKSSQSRRISISSVRAASLRASGLRAAGRSASLNSAGQDDVKFDSEATVELTPVTCNDELKKTFKGTAADELCSIKEVHTTEVVDLNSIQSTPKVMVPFNDKLAQSQCVPTSRWTSKSASLTNASLQQAPAPPDNWNSEQGAKHDIDSDATIVLEERVKSGSAPLELPSSGPKCMTSIEPFKPLEHEVGAGDIRPDTAVKVQTGHPSSQKPRKLVFDHVDSFVGGEGNAVSKALNADHNSVPSKQMSGIHAPSAREQQGSVLSRICVASKDLSYLDSHEPGEESQLNALNIVDKLVWLDASCMPDDVAKSPMPQDGSVKCHTGVKGLQSLAQAQQMRAVHDKLDVFDWEDSQVDEADSPDSEQAPVIARARKRRPEAHNLSRASKKQVISHQQKMESEKKGKQNNLFGTILEVPSVKPLRNEQEMMPQEPQMKPHTLLTTRLRNRPKAEPRPSGKGRKSPNLQRGPKKQDATEKQINESSKELEEGEQRVGNNMKGKVQQVAVEPRRPPCIKKVIGDRLGRGAESDQQKERDNKDSKAKLVDTSRADFKPEGDLGLALRTSEDDAAADIWIEAFSIAKSKKPDDNNFDLIKFKKRSALHDDTGQDVKKCRTAEPAVGTRDDEHRVISEQEEVSKEEDRVELGVSKKSKVIDVATNASHRSRRVSARLSKGEDHNHALEESIERKASMKQKARKSGSFDASHLKGSSRTLRSDHEEALERERNVLQKDEPEKETKIQQSEKLNKTAAATAKERKLDSCGSVTEHVEAYGLAGKAVQVEKGPKTRSKAQDSKSRVLSRVGKEHNQSERVDSKVSTAHGMHSKEVSRPCLPAAEAMQANLSEEKSSTKACRLRKQASMVFQQHPVGELNGHEARGELIAPTSGNDIEGTPTVGPSGEIKKGRSAESARAREGAPVGGLKRSRKGKAAADASVSELVKARDHVIPEPNVEELKCEKRDTSGGLRRTRNSIREDKVQRNEAVDASRELQSKCDASVSELVEARDHVALQPNVEELECQKRDMSEALRRTRNSIREGEAQRNMTVDAVRGLQSKCDLAINEQMLGDQAVKSNIRTIKPVSQQNTKTKASRMLENLTSCTVVDEGRRRKREAGEIRVLFSHSLTEDTVKHQRKILAKLRGQLATSALECTHFVSNGFARSQNMLISMAAGKVIATTLWLESCGQAHYFVDEKNYILRDEKKEREFGFSMITSLSAARRKPLFKDVKVIICPNTVPEPTALRAIVESAGGQVMDTKRSLSQSDIESDKPFIVIANQKSLDFCSQFLVKGLKVYSEELVLHGVVTQTLDFSRNRLFEDFNKRRGSRGIGNSKSNA